MNLVDMMLKVVDDSGLTQKEICARFDLGQTWIMDVRAGRKKNPGVLKVQEIIETLSGCDLTLNPRMPKHPGAKEGRATNKGSLGDIAPLGKPVKRNRK